MSDPIRNEIEWAKAIGETAAIMHHNGCSGDYVRAYMWSQWPAEVFDYPIYLKHARMKFRAVVRSLSGDHCRGKVAVIGGGVTGDIARLAAVNGAARRTVELCRNFQPCRNRVPGVDLVSKEKA